MKKIFKLGLVFTVLAILFTGCGTTTLQNMNSSIPMDTKNITMENIEKGINRAAASLGWKVEKSKNGELIATLSLREHIAKVKIVYTLTKYNITYIDSSNLKYNSSNNTIHSNYNGWIQNLNKGIQIQLGLL